VGRGADAFCIAVAVGWLVVAGFSVRAVSAEGLVQGPVTYFGDFVSPWRAQFNSDFLGYLAVASAWIVYRERVWWVGVAFALIQFLSGGLFLLPYLAVGLYRANGNVGELLLGHRYPRLPARA
jgi:hypothetical protein